MSGAPGQVADTRGRECAFAAVLRRVSVAALLVVMALPSDAQTRDVIADIRVHGNHTTPEADILTLSGLSRGEDGTERRLREAEQRLLASGRFAGVELRRRFASLDDPSAILVVIVVDEHEAVRDDDLVPGPFDRLRAASLWLPIVSHADGYGFTYGARVSVAGALGAGSRVSVPMTWGGERRVAVEAERTVAGPLPLVRASVALRRRVNPHFETADRRQDARVEAERPLRSWLRIGTAARVSRVEFGEAYDARHAAAGVRATLDTRLDPSFPRNAVHVAVGWEHLWFPGALGAPNDAGPAEGGAARWHADLRGYVGVAGPVVLALRGQLATSSAALPRAEQELLGGRDSLRGYRAGHRAGDNLAAFSAEVRVPINSPLSVGRFGIKAFVDAGTAWGSGERLGRQRFDRGQGAGIYVGVAALLADVEIAWPEEGKPRVHVGLGVSF
jgi:outer membrane protein assembly factor BamA